MRIAFIGPAPGSNSSNPRLPSRDRFLLGDKHSDDDEALGNPYGIRPVMDDVLDTELLAARDVVGVGRPSESDDGCACCDVAAERNSSQEVESLLLRAARRRTVHKKVSVMHTRM